MTDRRPEVAAAPAAATTRTERADEDQAAREKRDQAIEDLRAKYAPKIHRAEEKARHAQQVLEREEGQLKGAGLQTAVSAGATILTAIFGRKKLSYSTIGRGTTTARGAQRTMQQRDDVQHAKENLAAAQEELDALNADLEEKIARIRVT
jgi:molybdopterin converting factor small subunit